MIQKEIAIQCLEKLDIYKPYIRKFKSQQTLPCFFENYGGFWVDQEPELYTKIKEVEKKFNVLVYAVTHEFVEDMEMWSMLCIPEGCEIIDEVLGSFNNSNTNEFYAFAYSWNKSVEYFSEFGDIAVRCFGGGIKSIC
jgi:hypothetical protein